jgi:quercetin dioxygenase-like cupin family protein
MSLQLTNHEWEKTMKAANRFWKTLVIPVALAAMTGIALAAELNPAAVAYKLPDQIKWSEADARGVQTAVVAGDPGKPGFYAVLTKWLKGNHFSRPHFHPNDRYITVLQGTWWVGTGPKFDPANTTPMPAGSFVTHFGKQVHWDGAKDEDAVLLIVGEGPGTSTAAEEK